MIENINEHCDHYAAADDNALNAGFEMFGINNDDDSNKDVNAEPSNCANAEENVDNSGS